MGAVFKQGLFHKGPLGEIAWVALFLWDLITFMFAVTATIKLKLPMGRKTRARFHGERRCKQWKVAKSWNVFDHFRINFKYTVSFYLLSNREHKASCLKMVFFPKTISNFFSLSVNDIWNKSYMNCGNELKMKKWSSQWTKLNVNCINCVHCDDHFFIFIFSLSCIRYRNN